MKTHDRILPDVSVPEGNEPIVGEACRKAHESEKNGDVEVKTVATKTFQSISTYHILIHRESHFLINGIRRKRHANEK